MIGQTISHYKILEKLGEGGMGEVFLAEDTSLGRKVAIKFLASDKASDPESRQRFVHEARAQAMLSHPNIATFYEVGEEGEKVFIVMEYIEGQALSKVAQTEKLSLPEILDLAIQVGEGLQAAHEKGVVHRDIKPENVLVTSKRHAKITDFGLAKWKGATTLTQTGARMGTAYYMSPEQVEGKKTDHRTDIFSFGILLYELLCARKPFEGDTETAIFYDVVNTHPQPLARYARNLPDQLEKTVMKCLAKRPEERYQHVDELVTDLKAQRRASEIQNVPIHLTKPSRTRKKWTLVLVAAGTILIGVSAYVLLPHFFGSSGSPSDSQRKMLAVLPFENLGPAEEEYFADGITEEITARLANIHALGVIARTSVIQYKKTNKTIQQIGKELGVDYVLEGTIRWQKSPGGESRVRVTPQLIRTSDATHLWADVYDEVMAEVFQVQSNIAEKVISALGVALLEPERKSIEAKPTENLAAYEYYLRGNYYFNQKHHRWANILDAIEMYEKAVELDSNFALAYAMLSQAHAWIFWEKHDSSPERLAQAKQALDEALQLAPDLPEAHLSLGYNYYYISEDYDRALKEFSLVKKSQPNNSDLLAATGSAQVRKGKFEPALANLIQAADLDPGSLSKVHEVGRTYHFMRDYPEAERYYDRAISLRADWPRVYIDKAGLYLSWEGSSKKARKVLQEVAGKIDSVKLSAAWINCDLYDGNYQKALDRLYEPAKLADIYGRTHKPDYFLNKAQIHGFLEQLPLARACYDSARSILERWVPASLEDVQPRHRSYFSYLGIAYAGLGRKKEAIREGRKTVELLPRSKDAFGGPEWVQNLAQIYVMVGEFDAALDQLEYLLSIPSWVTIPVLRFDPVWAPLRNHPRFKKLVGTSPPAPSP